MCRCCTAGCCCAVDPTPTITWVAPRRWTVDGTATTTAGPDFGFYGTDYLPMVTVAQRLPDGHPYHASKLNLPPRGKRKRKTFKGSKAAKRQTRRRR